MKVNEKLSLTFLLEKSRTNSEGIQSIRVEFFLGKYVDLSFWDQKLKRVITKDHPNSKEARSRIGCLPLLPIPASIVERYANDPYCVARNRLLPVKSYHIMAI
jgi:hypothetical protein